MRATCPAHPILTDLNQGPVVWMDRLATFGHGRFPSTIRSALPPSTGGPHTPQLSCAAAPLSEAPSLCRATKLLLKNSNESLYSAAEIPPCSAALWVYVHSYRCNAPLPCFVRHVRQCKQQGGGRLTPPPPPPLVPFTCFRVPQTCLTPPAPNC
jgi:hypothetical protein